MVADLDTELCRVINVRVPVVSVRKRMGDEPWFNRECRTAFERKQLAQCQWVRSRSRADWMEFKLVQRYANTCHCAARVRFSQRCRNKLQFASSVHARWVTLKESVFGVDSFILPFRGVGGELVSGPALNAELLSEHFESKQSHDSVALLL